MTRISLTGIQTWRKWPLACLVILGLFLLVWMVIFFANKSAISKLEKAHREEIRQQIMDKGKLLTASFRQTDSAILSKKGQLLAQGYFSEIMKDKDIVFITVLDKKGIVRATSDLRFTREPVQKIPDLGGKILSRPGSSGADIEFYGPINDADGKQIGAVLVGVNYGANREKK